MFKKDLYMSFRVYVVPKSLFLLFIRKKPCFIIYNINHLISIIIVPILIHTHMQRRRRKKEKESKRGKRRKEKLQINIKLSFPTFIP